MITRAGRWLKTVFDPDRRMVVVLRRHRADEVFQPWPTTFEHRYPDVFAALADRLSAIEAPRILSFGCADGSEVRALRRAIPGAHITGIDINPRAIAKARRGDAHPLSHYVVASRVAPGNRFDAILAMAVFRHGVLETARPETCTDVMSFERFAQGVAMLDDVLLPGGYLAIVNAHFAFAQTPTAKTYESVLCSVDPAEDLPPRYGPDDRQSFERYAEILFRKTM